MKKPLSEWTAKEIVEECDRHVSCSSECRCYNSERKKCRLKPFPPPCWNLFEPPRWTEQDMKDAKTLKRLIACACFLWRDGGGPPKLYDEDGRFISVLRDCFAALPSETKATLDEIIGGGE